MLSQSSFLSHSNAGTMDEGRRSERAVRNENVAWFNTGRISTGQISIVGAPSTLGVSRWNKS